MLGKKHPAFSFEDETPCIEKARFIIDCYLAINVKKLLSQETTIVIPLQIVKLVEAEIIGVLAGFLDAIENNQHPVLESDETRIFFDYLICSRSEFWENPIIFILDQLVEDLWDPKNPESHLLVGYNILNTGDIEVEVAQWFIDDKLSNEMFTDEEAEVNEEK